MVVLCFKVSAQTVPTIIIDGIRATAINLSGFLYWLKEGQTLNVGNKVNSIYVLQYAIIPSQVGDNSLQFENLLNITSLQTVPSGKAWKIESAAIDPTDIITLGDSIGISPEYQSLTIVFTVLIFFC